MMGSEVRVHRYREEGDKFRWAWFTPEPGPVQIGPLSDRPEWLQAVVSAGKLGGHAAMWGLDRPLYVLWFKTDEHFNFIEFLTKDDDTNHPPPRA